MDNIITISSKAPDHLVSYWLGTLVGMGYRYKINHKSPLSRSLQGERRRMLYELEDARKRTDKPPFDKDGIRTILATGDSDSIKATVVKWADVRKWTPKSL